MGKYRDSIDIIADVLKAAAQGSGKTRIMYRANLSFKLLEKYLELTIGRGFLQFNSPKYEVTDRGKEFLERYNLFCDRYSKVQGSLKDLKGERESLYRSCLESQTSTKSNEPQWGDNDNKPSF